MKTGEILTLKTLQMKALHEGADKGDFVDALLAQDPDAADQITKNVCARIPIELAREMEAIGGLLDLNKREIITLAIRDFLDFAKFTMDQHDAFPKEGI